MMLFNPVSIRNLKLDNRLVMLATHLGYCGEDGKVTERLIAFYRERAKYRPGLIIVGGCYTEHLGMGSPTMIGLSSDEHIDGLKDLTEMIHSFNVPAVAQLYHAGRYAHSLVLGEQAVSASPIKCRLTRETPRELTIKEIHKTIKNFGKAAYRAKKAGFDAVEILGSAGYIINQFLAKTTNQRTDAYGGELDDRVKFPIEIIQSVRSEVGADFPILYRISGEDFVPNGLTIIDNKILAPRFVEAGIDCLNVTGGWHETRVPQITMNVPRGHYSYLAEALAEVVDVPVIACNRINSVSIAEHILSRSRVQLIGMSREFIAEPRFPELAREEMNRPILPCIACNQGCLDHVFMLEPVTCSINPLAGYENEKPLGPTGSGRIAVVGGGAAGMVASLVLARRGFEVTVYEERDRLGGLLNLAAKVPGRGEFAAYVSYMERELKNAGIEIKLNTLATPKLLVAGNYDSILCATGTIAGAPPIDGVEGAHVTTVYDALSFGLDDLGAVAVVGGRSLGCYGALALASKSDSVQIFESDEMIGIDLGRSTRWVILQQLKERKVEIHVNSKVMEVDTKRIIVYQDGKFNHFKADTVVLATSPQPRDRLVTQLKKNGLHVEDVGSATRPMNLLDVVRTTFDLASRIQIENSK